MDAVAIGHLSLMLARRAKAALGEAGIDAEIFRDDAVFRHAHREYTAQAGLAYLRVLSFDPEAFGLFVPGPQAEEAIRRLAAARIRVSMLEGGDELDAPARSVPAGEPASHPYRGEAEERVCLRCGEPEHGARPFGAPCALCGGTLVGHDVWLAARRKIARRWAALFVFALLGLGIASPRFVSCGSAVHVGR